jgi:IclR family KDG regulon transcriptional repressor
MLQALVACDFLTRDARSKTYRLGPGLLTLGTHSLNQWDLPSVALPYLERFTGVTGETVFLTALNRDRAICLQTVGAERSIQFFVRAGREMPFHCAASAKIILACQSNERIETILNDKPLFKFTSRTITNIDELKQHLENIRRQGYAICDGEMEVGVKAIAAPLIDSENQVIGSVAIVAPAERLNQEAENRLLPQLLDTAKEISRRLGYHG